MITVRARKDDINNEIVYYINLVKKVNGVDYILHIGRKTEMVYYELLSMLDFLNVEYEVDEDWMDQKGEKLLQINLEIKSITQWYRDSTREWCIDVNYHTDNVSGIVRYSDKKLNKANSKMVRNLHKDLLVDEIEYLFQNNILKIEKEKSYE